MNNMNNMNTFEQELYYWTHMLDESFVTIPQEKKKKMAEVFTQLLSQLTLKNLNKDAVNIIKTWFISDSEANDLEQLKEKYTSDFIKEIHDRILNYFKYKDQISKNEIDINNQKFILKSDQSIKLTEDRSIKYLDNLLKSFSQLANSSTNKHDKQYDFNDNDKKEIKLLGCTQHIACWRTTKFKITNKFIFYIWKNPDMKEHYGDYMYNSPFCTKESGHWADYSHYNSEYEQFWFFKLPEGCQKTSGDLNNPDVMSILDKMAGHGGELLVGLDDTYLDDDNIEDHNTRTSKTDILSFSFHDHQKTDYSNEIKQFYGKIIFSYKKFEFPNIIQCISSYKRQDDNVNNETIQLCNDVHNKKIESVVIPDSAHAIYKDTFSECRALTSVVIPKSVSIIDNGAFDSCVNLTEITIPSSVKILGIEAFCNCRSLESIVIPDSVTQVSRSIFSNCTSLRSVVLSKNIKSITYNMFANCPLKSIILPQSITSISTWAFQSCNELQTIRILSPVFEKFSYDAFDGCNNLKQIIVQNENVKNVFVNEDRQLEKIIKIQPMGNSKYSKYQLLGAIDYWKNVLNNKIS